MAHRFISGIRTECAGCPSVTRRWCPRFRAFGSWARVEIDLRGDALLGGGGGGVRGPVQRHLQQLISEDTRARDAVTLSFPDYEETCASLSAAEARDAYPTR